MHGGAWVTQLTKYFKLTFTLYETDIPTATMDRVEPLYNMFESMLSRNHNQPLLQSSDSGQSHPVLHLKFNVSDITVLFPYSTIPPTASVLPSVPEYFELRQSGGYTTESVSVAGFTFELEKVRLMRSVLHICVLL